jgi:hypothetical protein
MRTGTVHERVGQVRGPTGDDPITKDDVLAKFRKMTATCWSAATQDHVISLCDDLEHLDNTAELLALLEIERLPPVDMGGE